LITLKGLIRKLRHHQLSSDAPAFLAGSLTAQRFVQKYKKDKGKQDE
jgi:hypothetical protein